MNSRIWLLPKVLDRKYTFAEKIRHHVFGVRNVYDENMRQYIPTQYSLFKKFNKLGYTERNPYYSIGHSGSVTAHIQLEHNLLKQGGFSNKIPVEIIQRQIDYVVNQLKYINLKKSKTK
jgi:hypothetical protein